MTPNGRKKCLKEGCRRDAASFSNFCMEHGAGEREYVMKCEIGLSSDLLRSIEAPKGKGKKAPRKRRTKMKR